MAERLPHEDGTTFRTFRFARASRVPGPIGCLILLVACPVGVVLAIVALLASLWPFGRRRERVAPSPFAPAGDSGRDAAVRRLVRAMALDETFTLDEARQAGTLASGGATVDELLEDARARRWVETRPDGRLAVTERGRAEL